MEGDPGGEPVEDGVPCAWRAIAIAPDVTPMFPGVTGRRQAMSSAGTIDDCRGERVAYAERARRRPWPRRGPGELKR